MFLIFNGRYYLASNSSENCSDFITLQDLKFPLKPGRTLIDEEQNYFKKNSDKIKEKGLQIEKQINSGVGLEDLNKQITLLNHTLFFLENVVHQDNPHAKINKYHYFDSDEEKSNSPEKMIFLPRILDSNYFIANGRVYNLVEKNQPSYVFLNGKHYSFTRSLHTLDQVEESFQKLLEQELWTIARKNSSKYKEMHQKIAELEAKNNFLIQDLKVTRYGACLEAGNTGFDLANHFVYELILEHYNHTSNKKYAEGQSGIVMKVVNGQLDPQGIIRFAERNDRNSPFVIHPHGNCYGPLKLSGPEHEHKMYYIRNAAGLVKVKGGFYQP